MHPPISKRIENLSKTEPQVKTSLSIIKTSHRYLLWAIYIAVAGWVVTLVVPAGLLTGFMVPLTVSPGLWVIPMGLIVLSCGCLMASVALLARELTVKTKR
jgi:hypothetical protein